MKKRTELNRLVVATLSTSTIRPKASILYDTLRQENPEVLREQGVKSFKSFVRILVSFPDVRNIGTGVRTYAIKKMR